MPLRISRDAPLGVISLTGVIIVAAAAARSSYMDGQTTSTPVPGNSAFRQRRAVGEKTFAALRVSNLSGAYLVGTTVTLFVNGVASALVATIASGIDGAKVVVVADVHVNAGDDIDLRLDSPAGGGGTDGNTAFYSATLEYYT